MECTGMILAGFITMFRSVFHVDLKLIQESVETVNQPPNQLLYLSLLWSNPLPFVKKKGEEKKVGVGLLIT
eukprot:m.122022 g.122022  ORF g.122022 m.122022 type:complete len:71 (-) comp13715_c0_seq2:977-1189(-)